MKPEELADKINGAVAEYLDRPEVVGEFQKIVDAAVLAECERCAKIMSEFLDRYSSLLSEAAFDDGNDRVTKMRNGQ